MGLKEFWKKYKYNILIGLVYPFLIYVVVIGTANGIIYIKNLINAKLYINKKSGN